MTSIAGKTKTYWAAFAPSMAAVEVINKAVPFKKRSRDFFWYFPILDRSLKSCLGDFVALSKSQPI